MAVNINRKLVSIAIIGNFWWKYPGEISIIVTPCRWISTFRNTSDFLKEFYLHFRPRNICFNAYRYTAGFLVFRIRITLLEHNWQCSFSYIHDYASKWSFDILFYLLLRSCCLLFRLLRNTKRTFLLYLFLAMKFYFQRLNSTIQLRRTHSPTGLPQLCLFYINFFLMRSYYKFSSFVIVF